MKIVLTGFRGTGKTSAGRALAARLNLPFHDTDTMIEQRAGLPILKIFTIHGEDRFREQEREVIASLRDAGGVISTGGGAVCNPANVEHMRRGATVFLLSADPDVIESRISATDRPPLTDLAPADEIRELLRRRKQAYLSAADFCIDRGAISVDDTVEEICRVLSGRAIAPEDRAEGERLLAAMNPKPADVPLAVDHLTRICGIAGNPCSHSQSPRMYNRLFERFSINYRYTYLQWPDLEEIIRLARLIGIRGLSVTIPFKIDVMRYLDEVDGHAAAIGAVNTVLQCGGRMYGYNTDWIGVRRPLEHRQGGRAALFGAGGAAAAAVYALRSLEMDVMILNRTPEKARALAERAGCGWGPISAFDKDDFDVVVNATPIGMEPDPGSPLSADQLRAGMTVFDLVYTPPETPLLRLARSAGCETIPGTEMFVHQGCEQFRLFTGISVPPALIREVIT